MDSGYKRFNPMSGTEFGLASRFQAPQAPVEDERSFVKEMIVGSGTFVEQVADDLTFGLFQPDVIPQWEESRYPTATATGKTIGSLAGTIGSLMIAGGVANALPVSSSLMGLARTMVAGSSKARFVGGAIQGGTMGAFKGILDETARQVKEKDPSIPKLAAEAVEGVLNYGIDIGAASATKFAPRVVRSFAGGSAFATSSTMIRMARGEDTDAEDIIGDFITGAAFDMVLSGSGTVAKKNQIEAFRLKEEILEQTTKSKEEITQWAKDLVGSNRADRKDVVDGLTGLMLRAKDSIAKLDRSADEVTKIKRRQKADITRQLRKLPGFTGKFSLAEKKQKSVPSTQKKMFQDVLNNVFETKKFSDISVEEGEYFVNSIKEYIRMVDSDISEVKGELKDVGILSKATPWLRTIFEAGAGDMILPVVEGRRSMEVELTKLRKVAELLDSQYVKADGLDIKDPKAKKSLRVLIRALNGNEEAIQVVNSSSAKKAVFDDYRKLTDWMLSRTNAVRKLIGQKPIERIDDYFRWKFKVTSEGEIEGNIYGGHESLFGKERLKDIGEISTAKKRHSRVFLGDPSELSPKELERTLTVEDFLNTPAKLFTDMARHDLKNIFISDPIQILGRTLDYYQGAIPEGLQKTLVDYTKFCVIGVPTETDLKLNASIRKTFDVLDSTTAKVPFEGLRKLFEKEVGAIKKGLGNNPIAELNRLYGSTLNKAFISFRADLGIRNLSQRFLTLGLYGEKAVLKAMYPMKAMSSYERRLIQDHSFLTMSKGTGFEIETPEKGSTLAKVGRAAMSKSHESNVVFALKTAYYATKDKILDPAKWKLGWADPQRVKYKNNPEALQRALKGEMYFESEKKKLDMEMWFGAWSTQYDYSTLGTNPLQTGAAGKAIFKFWSWPINYNLNFAREMSYRLLNGTPAWSAGMRDAPKVGVWERAGILKHLAYTGAMIGMAESFDWDLSQAGYSAQTFGGATQGKPIQGPLPSSGTHGIQIIGSTYKLLTSNDAYERASAKKTLDYYLDPRIYAPGASAIKTLGRAEKKGAKTLLFRPIAKKKIKHDYGF